MVWLAEEGTSKLTTLTNARNHLYPHHVPRPRAVRTGFKDEVLVLSQLPTDGPQAVAKRHVPYALDWLTGVHGKRENHSEMFDGFTRVNPALCTGMW